VGDQQRAVEFVAVASPLDLAPGSQEADLHAGLVGARLSRPANGVTLFGVDRVGTDGTAREETVSRPVLTLTNDVS
jgi:hypothetical protein